MVNTIHIVSDLSINRKQKGGILPLLLAVVGVLQAYFEAHGGLLASAHKAIEMRLFAHYFLDTVCRRQRRERDARHAKVGLNQTMVVNAIVRIVSKIVAASMAAHRSVVNTTTCRDSSRSRSRIFLRGAETSALLLLPVLGIVSGDGVSVGGIEGVKRTLFFGEADFHTVRCHRRGRHRLQF